MRSSRARVSACVMQQHDYASWQHATPGKSGQCPPLQGRSIAGGHRARQRRQETHSSSSGGFTSRQGIAHARNKCLPPVVKHLRRGCFTVDTGGKADGGSRLVRHKVTGRAFKGEGTPLGVEAAWVVGAPVADAIRVLEQLQPAEQEWLFAPLLTGHHHRGTREGKPHTNEVLTVSASNQDIAGFISWINDYCTQRGLADRVPDVANRPARVTAAQFRRIVPA